MFQLYVRTTYIDIHTDKHYQKCCNNKLILPTLCTQHTAQISVWFVICKIVIVDFSATIWANVQNSTRLHFHVWLAVVQPSKYLENNNGTQGRKYQ